MLSKLEQAIQELEEQLRYLLEDIQQSGWKDERRTERIPARSEPVFDLSNPLDAERIIPEQAPLPFDFGRKYQHWHSAARAIIASNQPNRLSEFDDDYLSTKDMLADSHISQAQQFRLIDTIKSQLNILTAVPSHIQFSIYDIELEAYSIIIDDELTAAEHLMKKAFLRPAGVLAGVILERHLKNLLRKRQPPIKYRKNATISSLNDLCKDAVYDLIVWRKVQHLGDLRNLCAHDKIREPTTSEVGELLSGVSGIVRSHNF